MADTFDDRINELMAAVGPGPIVGKVEVDQVYAMPIERGQWVMYMGVEPGKALFAHTGMTRFLRESMVGHAAEYLQILANDTLDDMPTALPEAMVRIVELVSSRVTEYAPVRTGELASSGHPWVTVSGLKFYDRPPISPRNLAKEGKGYAAGRSAAQARAQAKANVAAARAARRQAAALRRQEKAQAAQERANARMEKALQREAAAERRKLRSLILHHGGIAPTKEFQVPRSVRRRKGLPYDYIREELQHYGYHFDTFDALLAAILEPY